MEKKSAENFKTLIEKTNCKQIVYLTGIVNQENLSIHLKSRKKVEEVLKSSKIPVTILRAAIIVRSGSASFEIIRDLVEKLPFMIAPKWLDTKCQPIGIRDVVKYLKGVMLRKDCLGKTFDIGGKDILTYKEMLLQYAEVRGLKRVILTLPFFSLKLSSYWLYFITSTNYNLARILVESMRIEVICRDEKLEEILQVHPLSYKEAVNAAFQKIEQNLILSSWKDSFISSNADEKFMKLAEAPEYGIVKEVRKVPVTDTVKTLENIWSIGGNRGWYYSDYLWKIRGFIDILAGGVGLRRGRTNPSQIYPGDALDFWRVIIANKQNKRLLLYSEMKLPGEAWLEFKITESDNKSFLKQTATFRPYGLAGRIYWYMLYPAHLFIFSNMAKNIEKYRKAN